MNPEVQRKQMQLERIEKRRAQKKRKRLHRRITAVITSLAVSAASVCAVYTASAKEVMITEINEFCGVNETVVMKTRVDSVGELLNESGVTVGDADKLSVSPETELEDQSEIVIMRGKQITIKAGGVEEIVSVTKSDTVSALAEAGYTPRENDEISANGANLAEADTISIIAVDVKDIETVTDIDFEVQYIDDPAILKGESRVVTEGQKGSLTAVERVTYHDGAEAARETLSETVTKQPVTKVIARGTKEPAKTVTAPVSGSISSNDTGSTINGMKYKKKITMQATAYSTSPSENGGYTVSAMGSQLRHGIAAVDPAVVPLGSKVYVESTDGSWTYGVASAEDTGGGIKGNKIDLCYEGSVASVNTFGRRSCNVYILE